MKSDLEFDYNFLRLRKDGEKTWDDIVKRFINELLKRNCKTSKKDLEWLLLNYYALPNSPALLTAGNEKFYASACSSYPVYDTMFDHNFSIMNSLSLANKATKAGIGTGFNFSKLRSKDEIVGNRHGLTGGPVSFLKAYNGFLEQITQSTRKSASMGLLHISHPDIVDYINCKKEDGKIETFNLSVILNNKFMVAVENDDYFELNYIKDDSLQNKKIKARLLFDLICERAWDNGEPGIFFEEHIKDDYPLENINILANPCSEAILTHSEDWLELCVLASVNLPLYDALNTDDRRRVISITTKMLNDIIDCQDYVTDYHKKGMKEINRKIGIGFAGVATILALKGEKYSSTFCEKYVTEITKEIGLFSLEESKKLGNVNNLGRYNTSLISIAPTSTLSNIFEYVNEMGCSYGIEPFFSIEEMIVTNSYGEYKITPKIVKYLKNNTSHIECANDLTWKEHLAPIKAYYNSLKGVGILQGASKTVNFKNNVTKDDIAETIMYAWKNNIKALSYYRDGSRKNQVFTTRDTVYDSNGRPINIEYHESPKRPKQLICDIYHTTSQGTKWVIFVSLYNGKPYEIFVGKEGNVNIPKKIKEGIIQKNGKWILILNKGQDNETCINEFDKVFENKVCASLSRTISMSLRHGVPLKYIVEQLLKDGGFDIINKAIARILKKYIKEKELVNKKCPNCEVDLVYISGCPTCQSCGYSKCG